MPTARKQKRKKTDGRNVVHSKPETRLCLVSNGKAITATRAKELLGWEEETKKTQFGSKFLLKFKGKKIRCSNNVTNRPLYLGTIASLKQEHLRKRWRFNGEPIIIGRTGLILNGQHTLLSIIFAAEAWISNSGDYPEWNKEPTMEKSITYGVQEDDETVNTMDTCKPRSLSDVIYRAHYFKGLPHNCQRRVARITDHCIRMLWVRTGFNTHAFVKQRTHSESIAFLSQHQRVLEAVKFIHENDEGSISKYISAGYASAALYLMATSKSKAESYFLAGTPCEELVTFDRWDKACSFFSDLSSNDKKLEPLREAMGKLYENEHIRWIERWTVIIKTWEFYVNDKLKTMTMDDVYPKFAFRNDTECLSEHALFGGIDVGEDGPVFATNDDPSKSDIKKGKAKIPRKVKPENLVAKRAGENWAKGDTAWLHTPHNPEDEPQFSTLKDNPFKCADGNVRVMILIDGDTWEEKVKYLSLSRFEIST